MPPSSQDQAKKWLRQMVEKDIITQTEFESVKK